MVEPSPPAPRGIFISYRREETSYPAAWLFDRLADRFGQAQIFKDVDSIEPGDDFVDTISRAVASCDVLLALIGDQWLTVADADGRRRLDDANDFVRLELEAALSRDIRVIPVLVEGASMPRAEDLPPSLAKLARRQALELSPSRFAADLGRLLRVLDRTLAETAAPAEAAPAEAAGAAGAAEMAGTEPETEPERQREPVAVPPAAAPTPSPPRRERAPSPPGWRSFVATRGRIAAVVVAAAILLLVIVLAFSSGNGGHSPSDGGDETPSEEEAPAPDESSLPAPAPAPAPPVRVVVARPASGGAGGGPLLE